MVETLVSILIVGGLVVAAMNTAGAAMTGRKKIGDRGRGTLLAQDLLGEILLQAYQEPVDTPTFGREASESGSDRLSYDDVDDYDGWTASPPELKDGTIMSDLVDWKRSVSVAWVQPYDLSNVNGGETGVKRIMVTVLRNGLTVAKLVAIRTGAPPERVVDPRKLYMSIQ